MINLLPKDQRVGIRKEYHLRVLATLLVMFLALAGIAVALLAPSYVLTVYKRKAAEGMYIRTSNEAEKKYIELNAHLTKVKSTLAAIKPNTAQKLLTSIIPLITKHQLDQIDITTIDYAQTKGDSFAVTVRGIAKSRQGLINFAKALESEPGIAPIELPVSTLAKDANIDFSFVIKNKP
ncbi:hypothetical protein KW782_04125 [Candidatus Parcubacteria bacterium]|nr:hypothetical protein [Candidatus Parcubacteria bacterium]